MPERSEGSVPPYEQRFNAEASDREIGQKLFSVVEATYEGWRLRTGSKFPVGRSTLTGQRSIALQLSPYVNSFFVEIERFGSSDERGHIQFNLGPGGGLQDYSTHGYTAERDPKPRAIAEMLIDELPTVTDVVGR